MAAARAHADRQIGDQADPHAGVTRRLLHPREAAVGKPLRENVEADLLLLFAGEARNVLVLALAPALRPLAPIPLLLRAVPMLVERFEQGMFVQPVAALAFECVKVRGE